MVVTFTGAKGKAEIEMPYDPRHTTTTPDSRDDRPIPSERLEYRVWLHSGELRSLAGKGAALPYTIRVETTDGKSIDLKNPNMKLTDLPEGQLTAVIRSGLASEPLRGCAWLVGSIVPLYAYACPSFSLQAQRRKTTMKARGRFLPKAKREEITDGILKIVQKARLPAAAESGGAKPTGASVKDVFSSKGSTANPTTVKVLKGLPDLAGVGNTFPFPVATFPGTELGELHVMHFHKNSGFSEDPFSHAKVPSAVTHVKVGMPKNVDLSQIQGVVANFKSVGAEHASLAMASHPDEGHTIPTQGGDKPRFVRTPNFRVVAGRKELASFAKKKDLPYTIDITLKTGKVITLVDPGMILKWAELSAR